MQQRYTVVSYRPCFTIVRHRNEYRNAGVADFCVANVVKESRVDGRRRWQKDGSPSNNFFSVLFSRSEWEVCSISTEFREHRNDGALVPDEKEFRDITAEVSNFFTQMSTTIINEMEG